MEHRMRFAALFILSLALIAFELGIMRVFSVGSWSNFGNLIISTALLGFGVAGALLTFLDKSVKKHSSTWLYWCSFIFMISMPLAQIVSQQIPFEPTFLASDLRQLWWIAVYYLVFSVPFVSGAAFVGVAFVDLKDRVHQLYFWNMAGSGIGGFFVILFMYWFSPADILIPIVFMIFAANLLVLFSKNEAGQYQVPTKRFALSFISALGIVIVLHSFGAIRVSEFKSISYAEKYPELELKHYSYSPAGEYQVFKSSYFHFAPGLSDNAALIEGGVPSQPFWALFVDGSGPIGIMGKLEADKAAYVDYLPMAAPYMIRENPRVLLVNLGGGINAQVARYKGAKEVLVLERDSSLIQLIKDDPEVSAFTGKLLSTEPVKVLESDARSWCADHPDTYDIVEISLVDSIGLSDSGGYGVHENYTYTKEAIKNYLSGLNENGLLSITVWNHLSPPRNVPRILNTVCEALRELGYEDAQNHLFMFDQLRSTATILVGKSAFNDKDIHTLRRFVNRNSFNMIHYPGQALPEKDVLSLVHAYRARFENSQEEVDANFTPSELYSLLLNAFAQGRGREIEQAYPFDIRVMTDDRPYYSAYLKLGELGMYLDDIPEVSEEWGYLLLLGILIQAILFGLIVILIPVLGRWKTVFQKQKGKSGVILYFASLGLSYMLVEIYFIQRLVDYLGNPIYSTSIVLTIMLVISGVGNLVSPKLSKNRAVRVRIAVAGIVVMLLMYIFCLSPIIEASRNWAMILKILMTVVLVGPCAFFMGMPYPNGLEALSEKRPSLLPWAWGMNGGLSVAGTALAWILSVSGGFTVLLLSVMILYVLVGLVYPVNELTE